MRSVKLNNQFAKLDEEQQQSFYQNAGNLQDVSNASFQTTKHKSIINQSTIYDNIKVIARFYPAITKKQSIGIKIQNEKTVKFRYKDNTSYKFQFDQIFTGECTQLDVYESAGKPIVEYCLQGLNGTILAYGQTGSGKTYTMVGPNIYDQDRMGIIPRCIKDLFYFINNYPFDYEFSLRFSFLEIYNEHIKDLLNPQQQDLKIRENQNQNIFIQNLTEVNVSTKEEVFHLLEIGNSQRAICATQMNEESSRSHTITIFQLTSKSEMEAKTGRIYLVDLAGSEKLRDCNSAIQTETKNINTSLMTLGKIISQLTEQKQNHIAYRESKLTYILKHSLGGNSKTTLITNCSTYPENLSETINTLRFGSKAKLVRNTPIINKESSIQQLKLQIEKLQNQLREKESFIQQSMQASSFNLDISSIIQTSNIQSEENTLLFNQQKFYQEKIESLEVKISQMLEDFVKFENAHSNLKDEHLKKQQQLQQCQQEIKIKDRKIEELELQNQVFLMEIQELYQNTTNVTSNEFQGQQNKLKECLQEIERYKQICNKNEGKIKELQKSLQESLTYNNNFNSIQESRENFIQQQKQYQSANKLYKPIKRNANSDQEKIQSNNADQVSSQLLTLTNTLNTAIENFAIGYGNIQTLNQQSTLKNQCNQSPMKNSQCDNSNTSSQKSLQNSKDNSGSNIQIKLEKIEFKKLTGQLQTIQSSVNEIIQTKNQQEETLSLIESKKQQQYENQQIKIQNQQFQIQLQNKDDQINQLKCQLSGLNEQVQKIKNLSSSIQDFSSLIK